MKLFNFYYDGALVAEGCIFSNGRVAINWTIPNKPESMIWYASYEDAVAIHMNDNKCSQKFVNSEVDNHNISNSTLDWYQQQALRTNSSSDDRSKFVKNALAIAGEAGELANLIKKMIWHGHHVTLDSVADEIGDILWYLAVFSHEIGFKLSDVANRNIEKLLKRYPNGFSEEDSINRRD